MRCGMSLLHNIMPRLWPQVCAKVRDTYLHDLSMIIIAVKGATAKTIDVPSTGNTRPNSQRACVAQALAEAGQQNSKNIPHRNDARHDVKFLEEGSCNA